MEDLFKFNQIFAPWFIQTLHPGETEALALICAGKSGDAYFCTSDAPAIRALAMIHCSEKGISFEELLETCCLPKSLQIQYTSCFFNTNLKQGSNNLVTGDGYASRDIDRILKSLDL